MSEEHDIECAGSDKQIDDKKEDNSDVKNAVAIADGDKVDEDSANASKELGSAIDKALVVTNENNVQNGANVRNKGELGWANEGTEFKVSWSLPEGSTTAGDYIALCVAGKYLVTFKNYTFLTLLSPLRIYSQQQTQLTF